jgi:CBS domain containing-hemolysin-like protein
MANDTNSNGNSLIGSIRNWLRLRDNGRLPDEIHDLIDSREESDIPLTEEEKHLIVASLKFSSVSVDSVSVPRADIVTVGATMKFDEVIEVFKKSGHSRLPIIRNNMDDVIGFITLKDIVRFIGTEAEFDLRKVARPCTFVPDTQSIAHVLQEMRRAKVQMAVVLDEYGGTAGLITLKDILEHLVGDIEDENEQDEPTLFIPLPGGKYQLDPRMPIDELEERLKLSFLMADEEEDEERPYETVGGLVLSLARHVPDVGESFTLPNGCTFKVLEADARRILKLELHLPVRKKIPTPSLGGSKS